MAIDHAADPVAIDHDGKQFIAVCKECGKHLFRPTQDMIGGLPALGPWTHRTDKWHRPTRRSPQQVDGQRGFW